jgi:hypothetical protein
MTECRIGQQQDSERQGFGLPAKTPVPGEKSRARRRGQSDREEVARAKEDMARTD